LSTLVDVAHTRSGQRFPIGFRHDTARGNFMPGPQNFEIGNAPQGGNYAAPLVGFDIGDRLAKLPEEYYAARMRAPVIDPRTGQPTSDRPLVLKALAERGTPSGDDDIDYKLGIRLGDEAFWFACNVGQPPWLDCIITWMNYALRSEGKEFGPLEHWSMGPLRNTKHERFAQELAEGKSMIEAYKAASYKPNRSHASRLVAKGNIKGRVAELQDAAAAKVELTLESLIEEAAGIQDKATKAGQYSAAIAALIAKSKLAGRWIDRAEQRNTNVVYAVSDKPMSDEEWEHQFCTEH
jgi:hypothetical protein